MSTHAEFDPTTLANHSFDPGRDDGNAELVLNVMKTDIWPSIAPGRVVKRSGYNLDKFEAHAALSSLTDAGWVAKRERGFYDLIVDPRDDVPTWPVTWNDRHDLPDPLPSEPPNKEHARAVHEQYRTR